MRPFTIKVPINADTHRPSQSFEADNDEWFNVFAAVFRYNARHKP